MNRREFCKVMGLTPLVGLPAVNPKPSNKGLGVIKCKQWLEKIDGIVGSKHILLCGIMTIRTVLDNSNRIMADFVGTTNELRFQGCYPNTFLVGNMWRDRHDSLVNINIHWKQRGYALTVVDARKASVRRLPVYESRDYSDLVPWCDPNNIPWIGE